MSSTSDKTGNHVGIIKANKNHAPSNCNSSICVLDQLTSSVFGVHNPPQDWADVALLIPHEAIRRELTAMCASTDKLVHAAAANAKSNGDKKMEHQLRQQQQPLKGFEGWKAVYFCEWFAGPLTDLVHEHHDNEELIYFPWVKTRVDMTIWTATRLSHGHEELMDMMDSAGNLCRRIIAKKGINCEEDLVELQTQLHAFHDFMIEHLSEEEQDIPPLLRAQFTQQEELETVKKLTMRSGIKGIRILLPSIVNAMQQWATPEFFEEFWMGIPRPVRHLASNYFIPDFENCIAAKRDAPIWNPCSLNRNQKRPALQRVKCFTLSFCFPCLI